MIDVPFETVKKAEINLTLCHKEWMISNFFILFGIQDDQKTKSLRGLFECKMQVEQNSRFQTVFETFSDFDRFSDMNRVQFSADVGLHISMKSARRCRKRRTKIERSMDPGVNDHDDATKLMI